MLDQFTQPTGSTSKLVNTQAVAYATGYTHGQVKILKAGLELSDVFIVINDLTDKVYYTGSATGSVISWSESGDNLSLVTSNSTYVLEKFHVTPQSMTVSFAKNYTNFIAGQRVFLKDIGYFFKFVTSRLLIANLSTSEMTADDELHKLVVSGGMLEFDDYAKLPELESENYARYLAKLRTNSAISMLAYGDSITWGQGLAPASAQYPRPYPLILAETLSSITQSAWTQTNLGTPGDATINEYMRTANLQTDADISTIMLGVNDILRATDNSKDPDGILEDNPYSAVNYEKIMRKFIARELINGRCVMVYGTHQWLSGASPEPLGSLTACYSSDA